MASWTVGYLFPDDLEIYGFDPRTMAFAQLMAGGQLTNRLIARVQASWQERAFSGTGLEGFDSDAFIVSVGLELLLKSSTALFFNFHEDFFVNFRGQPDFMVDIGFRHLFFSRKSGPPPQQRTAWCGANP